MPWFKVDDAFHSHPKAMRAGTAALGLWARCGSWAAQQLTDGYVPVDLALLYGTKAMVRSLVESGLWHETDGGYLFHEWSPINPTRAEVETIRETKRKSGSAGGRASGRARAKDKQEPSTDEAPCFASGSELPNTTPIPSLKELTPPTPPNTGGKPKTNAPPRTDVERLCRHLAARMVENGCREPGISERWRRAARLLLDEDKRPLDEALRLIDWSQNDDFWRSNIQSLPKFREKYDQLRLKAAGAGLFRTPAERKNAWATR